MIDLPINTKLATQILSNFIHSEITRVGFSRAVLGLSGGLDLALSCFLTVRAFGRRKCAGNKDAISQFVARFIG